MNDEALFYQHEAEERRIREANSQLAVLRARQRMRDVAISEENGSSIFPMPTTLKTVFESGPNPAALSPRGNYVNDSFPNQHSASIYEGTVAQRMWFELLGRMSPPANRSTSQSYSSSEIGATGTFSIGGINERRLVRGARW